MSRRDRAAALELASTNNARRKAIVDRRREISRKLAVTGVEESKEGAETAEQRGGSKRSLGSTHMKHSSSGQ